jgi:hypothetical protein
MTLRNRRRETPFNETPIEKPPHSNGHFRNPIRFTNKPATGSMPNTRIASHQHKPQQNIETDFGNANAAEFLSRFNNMNPIGSRKQNQAQTTTTNNSQTRVTDSIAKKLSDVNEKLKRATFYNGYSRKYCFFLSN